MATITSYLVDTKPKFASPSHPAISLSRCPFRHIQARQREGTFYGNVWVHRIRVVSSHDPDGSSARIYHSPSPTYGSGLLQFEHAAGEKKEIGRPRRSLLEGTNGGLLEAHCQ